MSAPSMKSVAESMVRRLTNAGYESVFAGGCVRDSLLGVEPKDYDVATSARPEDVLKLFPGGNTVGAHFGVILVREHGHSIEIATFRTDGDYQDGRRPDSVAFASAEEDAQRRDFTINGMFFDPVSGEVVDHVGGRADLQQGVIRAIGDPGQRFAEDYLRLLRAIRFASRFGFSIDPNTWAAICAEANNITKISPERIRDELDRIWTSPAEKRVQGFDLLVDSGLMIAILPEILDLQGCEQPPQWHPEGDVFVHTRIMLGLLPDDASLPLVLSVLFHDIAKPATYSYDPGEDRIRFNGHDKLGAEMSESILRRLRYSNEVIEAVYSGVENHMNFKDVQKMRTSKLKRFMARPHFDDEMELHRVDCSSSNGMLDNYEFLQEKAQAFANEPLIPERLVTGKDLMDHGWSAGPALGKILREIQDLQLEGSLTTRDEVLEWLSQRTKSD
jgi:putative nucleotidyltransferase with HDIG domain